MFSYFLTSKIFLSLCSYTLYSSILLLIGCFIHILISLNFYLREVYFLRLVHFNLAECIPLIFTVTYLLLVILSIILISFKVRLTTFTFLSEYENGLMRITLLVVITLATINVIISILCFIIEGNLIKRTAKGLNDGIENYNNDQKSKELIDRIQIRHQCCGIVSHKDWFKRVWFKKRIDSEEICLEKHFLNRSSMDEHIPFSCCSDVLLRPCIHHFLQSDKHFYDYDFIGGTLHTFWTEGCLEKVANYYLSAFHSVNISNFIVMALYFVQIFFDRIVQTADSTTFVNGHLHGWVFMKPAMDPFLFPEKKYNPGFIKRMFYEGSDKRKKYHALQQSRKRVSSTKRSVKFRDSVDSEILNQYKVAKNNL